MAAVGSPYAAGKAPGSIVLGDFNGDGIQDLAVTNQNNSNGTVTVLLGNASGGFTSAPGSPFGHGFFVSPAVGDFNRDGIQDVAVVDAVTGNIMVLLGSVSAGLNLGKDISVGSAV